MYLNDVKHSPFYINYMAILILIVAVSTANKQYVLFKQIISRKRLKVCNTITALLFIKFQVSGPHYQKTAKFYTRENDFIHVIWISNI